MQKRIKKVKRLEKHVNNNKKKMKIDSNKEIRLKIPEITFSQ